MSKILNVYFHEKKIGQLQQNKYGEISFAYCASWLNDPKAIAISFSLPLQAAPFIQNRDTQAHS